MIQAWESFSYWFPFPSFPFDLSRESTSLAIPRNHNSVLTQDFKKVLNIFLLMSQGTTFQVFNHLYSPQIFGIYEKHLNSVGKKIKNNVLNSGSISTLIVGVNLWFDSDFKAFPQIFWGLYFLLIPPGFILSVKWIPHLIIQSLMSPPRFLVYEIIRWRPK